MVNRIGEQFGNYRLVRLLGQGGFAEVYLGEHMDLGTKAAIKVLHTQLNPADIDAFRAEARTIAHLLHPHIIRVLDFSATGSTPFLVMDYAAGGTMRERYPRGTIVPLVTIISSIQQIADALQYAHDEKLIHRDIKPENILLDQRDNLPLSDFGIALVAQSSRYQNTQEVIGTAAYMSPEQIQGKPRPASDQYSLGIVVYEWLSGTRPFSGSFTEVCSQHIFAPPPSLRERVPTISPEIERVVMTAMAKDPKQRFSSIRAFAITLQQASQAGMSPTASTALAILPMPTQTPPAQQVQQQPASQIPAREAPQAIPLQEKRPVARPTQPAGEPVGAEIPTTPNPSGSVSGNIRLVEFIQIIRNKWRLTPKDAMNLLHLKNLNNMNYGDLLRQLEPLVEQRATNTPTQKSLTDQLEQSPPIIPPRPQTNNPRSRGSQKWAFKANSSVTSSPAVVNGIVYFGSNDHSLYALDAASGQKAWYFHTHGQVHSSPTVVDGVIYFGSYDGKLYALDVTSGQERWSFQTGDKVHSSPTVVNGVVYFGSFDHNLYALDATSGQQKWSFQTGVWLSRGNRVHSSLAVVDGVIYFGSDDYKLYAVNATKGGRIWSSTIGKIRSSPAVVNGIVYFGTYDHKLYAYQNKGGDEWFEWFEKWSFTTGGKVHSSPTVVNGVVYFGSYDGRLYALDAASGQEKWSFHTGSAVHSSPTVVSGVAYFGSNDHNLYALDATSGQQKWSFRTRGKVQSSPAVANGIAYVGSDDGNLYAIFA